MIDIIIPTYKQSKYTVECLKSLRQYTDLKYRVIWIDNGSSKKSRECVLNELKNHNYKTIWTHERLGFIRATNLGIKEALKGNADYIMLQNNDTLFTKHSIKNMLKPLKNNNVVSVGPNTTAGTSQQSWDLINIKECIFPNLSNISDEEKVDILEKKFKNNYFLVPKIAFFSSIFKREVFEVLGFLDEDLGEGYYDDDLFCHKIINNGWEIAYMPSAYVHHFNRTTFSDVYSLDMILLQMNENKKIYEKKRK